MSPRLEDNVCHAAVTTGSYQTASESVAKWGVEVSSSVISEHVREAAIICSAQREQRVDRALDLRTRDDVAAQAAARLAGEEFALVIMLDGWMRRERGVQWGEKPPEAPAKRVEWKETKSAIIFRLDSRYRKNGRPVIVEKYYVSWHGEPEQVGRQVYAEALRRGLRQAQKVYIVADGAVWIWNLVEDRFSWAQAGLDFYHASQHLWVVAHELYGESIQAQQLVGPMLHQLRHGGESGVVASLEQLQEICAELEPGKQENVHREIDYFRKHKAHMHYANLELEGCPIGSGATESTCSQFQNRFKRTGQFWTTDGFQSLMDLEIARRNKDWNQIWTKPV